MFAEPKAPQKKFKYFLVSLENIAYKIAIKSGFREVLNTSISKACIFSKVFGPEAAETVKKLEFSTFFKANHFNTFSGNYPHFQRSRRPPQTFFLSNRNSNLAKFVSLYISSCALLSITDRMEAL